MDVLIQFLLGFGFWSFAFGVVWALSFYLFRDLHESPYRAWWIDRLHGKGLEERYRGLLSALLDRTDEWLSHDAASRSPAGEAARAWSAPLLYGCLLLALAYPIFSVILTWTFTGAPGRLGSIVLIAGEGRTWVRALMTLGLAAALVAGWRLGRAVGAGPTFALLALSVAAMGVTLQADIAGSALANPLFMAITLVGCIVGPLAIGTTEPLGYRLLTGRMVAGGGAVTVLAFSAVVAGMPGLGVAVLLGSAAQCWAGRLACRPCTALAVFGLLLTVLLIAAVALVPSVGKGMTGEVRASLVLFLGILPLLNAAADFGSVGLTRYWLRKGVNGNLLWNAFRDAVAAFAILVLLGLAMIAAIRFARPLDGRSLVDMQGLFAALRSDAARDYRWLYFCFFSTLLPTVLHGAVALFGLLTLVPLWLSHSIAGGLRSSDPARGRLASLALSLCLAGAATLPLFLCWAVVALFGRPILDSLLWLFETFAIAIGAL